MNQLENTLTYSGQPSNFGSENEQRSAVAMAATRRCDLGTIANEERPPLAGIKYLFNDENRIDASPPKWIHCFNHGSPAAANP